MDVRSIEDQVRRAGAHAPETADWGTVTWLVREGEPAGAEQTVGLAVFDPGKGNVEHVHPNCEEIVYVVAGAVRHTLGDDATELGEGDLIVVPRGVAHRLENAGLEPARVWIVFSAADRQFVPTGR
jgi:quercetin dioxygenase-like cupin family protein